MNVTQLYKDYNIHIAQSGERHYRYNWINTSCPFCSGNKGNHLGYSIKDDYFRCHRCGFKTHKEVILALTNKPANKVLKLLKKYKGKATYQKQKKVVVEKPKTLVEPSNLTPLNSFHRKYLENRNFDVDYLIDTFELQSTSPISKLDKYDYSNRIYYPIYHNNDKVSFQTRTVNSKETVKYKTCPPEYETVFHKDILYGRQEFWCKTGIIVEGVTDVWRIGPYACATFGVKYSSNQVREIYRNFKRVAVMYDNDKNSKTNTGEENACKLIDELLFLGVDAFRVRPDSDPGNMTDDEAKYLVKQIIGGNK